MWFWVVVLELVYDNVNTTHKILEKQQLRVLKKKVHQVIDLW